MRIYEKLAIISTSAVLSFAAINAPVQATTFFEVGDAGDTFNNAQVVSCLGGASIDGIEGRLDLRNDNDYFRFFFGGGGVLKIETGPYFNTGFPFNPFPAFQLFNTNNSLVGGYFDGDFTFGVGDISGSFIAFYGGRSELNFRNLSAGEYVLKVDGTGQTNAPKPVYEGDYSIKLSGAEFIRDQPCPEPSTLPQQSVPEPSTLVGMIVAGGIGWLMKMKISGLGRKN